MHYGRRHWRATFFVALGLLFVVGLIGAPTIIATPAGTTPAAGAATPGSPVVTALSPASVSAGGGATVTVTGSAFTGATAVNFGTNASSSFTVQSDTSIVAVAPVGAATVAVHVVTPAGTSATVRFDQLTYVATGQPPISASGSALDVGGTPTTFSGVNAYELPTDYGVNGGCGDESSPAQMTSFFSSLAPGSIVRFDAFQGSMAINYFTHQLDWAPLDQVFFLAAQYGVYVIPVITGQGAGCDGGHWEDPTWYRTGYKSVFNTAANSDGLGLNPLSYWQYTLDLVDRYAASPALAMWEPISEPDPTTCPAADEPSNCAGTATCPSESAATSALLTFYTSVGDKIHSLDPGSLVEDGSLDGGQCGTVNDDFATVAASPGIDVLSIHYYPGQLPGGGSDWSGFNARLAQEATLGMPIITGEVGIQASADGDPSCDTLAQRSTDLQTEMSAQFAAGISAFLVWNWDPAPLGLCSDNTGVGDPLMTWLDTPS